MMAEPPTLVQITLATCDSAEALQDWAQGAGAGDCRCYAQGRVPPRAHPGFIRARTLCDSGLVSLRQEMDPVTRVTRYFARRSSTAWTGGAVGTSRPVPPARPPHGDAEAQLLEIARKSARSGKPLPSNAVLARATGLRTPIDASNRLRKLVKAGLIEIEHQGPNLPRLVRLAKKERAQ